jgi:hypothetical protein
MGTSEAIYRRDERRWRLSHRRPGYICCEPNSLIRIRGLQPQLRPQVERAAD